jgi:hypothetical protein
LLGRVLIKDIALEPFVFCHLPLLRHGAKGMKLNNKARAFEMRILGKEILNLVGERREEAMKAYRKLLSSTSDELIYLIARALREKAYLTISAFAVIPPILVIFIFTWSPGFALATNMTKP